MVTNIYVYNPQPGGETGFQADAFLNVGKVSIKDSKYGSDINLNLSWFSGSGTSSGLISFGNDYFRDASIEWKKKWNKQLKTTLQVQYLYYNKSVIEGGLHDNITAGTVAINTIYNFTETGSLHFELQHLYTENDLKNWAATLVEVSFAPKWSFFVSDLYNYGKTDIHYPNVGGYYSAGGSRFGLSYGRQRAGLYCLGGVCRYVPAATGLTITFITTFNQ